MDICQPDQTMVCTCIGDYTCTLRKKRIKHTSSNIDNHYNANLDRTFVNMTEGFPGLVVTHWTAGYCNCTVWNKITFPFLNFYGASVEVWKCVNNFISRSANLCRELCYHGLRKSSVQYHTIKRGTKSSQTTFKCMENAPNNTTDLHSLASPWLHGISNHRQFNCWTTRSIQQKKGEYVLFSFHTHEYTNVL